ncbi:carboxypeptidase regulatory-like domain-containing protein, partial [uncultured Chloroflexus sp.]|uniref:carboxypeptidase regulatory-like domain-containing protein n=1 Tax=uncultured Chloroflexus sp. TaxID=214040 RepID=UPI0026137B8F
MHIPLHIISGWVRDASGTPVAGVTVSDGTRSATTDAAGQYTLTNVPTGTYILTPARSGYTFSPPTRTVTVNGNVSGMDFIADPISSIRPIDMTVWFYRVPTAQQRVVYEDMFRFFADALFEMSNGVHQLRNVRVISDPAQRPQANIYWVERCWPNAHISGYGINGLRILMCDQFVDNNGAVVFDYLNAPAGREQGGYTLAHELGHYFYSLYDEYKGRDACNAARPGRPCRDDVPVSPSIMNSHWNAGNGVYEWLNFSTALNNTYQTAQHRMYRASGWETLARSPDADPRDGVLNNYPRRLYHPELAAVAPPSGQQPRIDLTPGHQARRLLRITWETTTASLAGATDLTASLHALNGGAVTYPEPIRLLAFVQRTHTIAGATVDGVVQTPGGQRHPVTLRDDGVAPDLIADDGVYAGVILPAENGEHRIEMEDVLDVSQRPYDPAYPVGCLDEAGKELHDAPRGVPPLQAEQPVRQDDEYERRGVANLFLAIEPLRGWRARRDFAEQLRLPADEDYPQARRIVLVADNLNP